MHFLETTWNGIKWYIKTRLSVLRAYVEKTIKPYVTVYNILNSKSNIPIEPSSVLTSVQHK